MNDNFFDAIARIAPLYAGVWIKAFLQSVIVLSLVAVWCSFSARAAAATRHLIWFLALLSLPFLLIVALTPDSSHRSIWSLTTDLESGNKLSLRLSVTTSGSEVNASAPGDRSAPFQPIASSIQSPPSITAHFSSAWLVSAVLIWAGGALLRGLSILVGHQQLRRRARNAVLLNRPVIKNGLEGTHLGEATNWSHLLRDSCNKLGLRRPPALLLSPQNSMPLTWGWLRPKVLLPAQARDWPVDKCHVVLLHELAHTKRRDYLTQLIAEISAALFWPNPLVWVGIRRMRAERERACDDLVLNTGCKSSDYASHLLAIARAFRHVRFVPGIAMARSAQLQARITAITDPTRKRQLRPFAAVLIIGLVGGLVGCVAATSGGRAADKNTSSALRQQQLDHLKSFAIAKLKQSENLAARAGETISPDFRQFFNAAITGDSQTVTNRYEYYKRHHPQYVSESNAVESLHTPYWQPVLEICLAYDHVLLCEPKYTQLLLTSIPRGSIYFGGTDPGRGVPTAFAKSSIDADPFFCLSQNPLADSSYLDYLHAMYGEKIYTPSFEDSQKCFQEYTADAERRLENNQLKPGEVVRKVDGKVQVSGQVAVMSINALLVKVTFDKNPDREFYIEESFPLDWMYPHLEPHGLIMRINRQPYPQLPHEVLRRDHEYWSRIVRQMLGNSIDDSTTVPELAAFVNRVYVRKDLKDFNGDPLYVQNDYAKKIFSKLRSAIAGVYAWRLSPEVPAEFKALSGPHKDQLINEADLAFRQAFALCPYSPEAVYRYANFLIQFNRQEDARRITQASLEVNPVNVHVKTLLQNIEKLRNN